MFEKRLIACPEFQRLRFIKQLGFVSLVYPGAEYSRFLHSIGVCHQAKNMVDKINHNLRMVKRYPSYRLTGRGLAASEHVGLEDTVNEALLISELERVVISAAALLHDVPHAAFSHEIEGVPQRQITSSDTGKNVIPSHDDTDENPALFLYLFHPNSKLAQVVRSFNGKFFSTLKSYLESLRNTCTPYTEWVDEFLRFLESDAVTEDGYVQVVEKSAATNHIICQAGERPLGSQFAIPGAPSERGLPILGVMVFEIHLFEEQHEWMLQEERERFLGHNGQYSGKEVVSSWDGESGRLYWKPIAGWFRAYRRDVIGNTICADLIDYVNRDGYHTGIVSEIDLKFLDRMTIAREVLPRDEKKPDTPGKESGAVFPYEEIPISCEHIVFDVFDHKRGCLRQSVLTEILAYLQARYLLCERVYTHRVVEGARAMLQELVGVLHEIRPTEGTDDRLPALIAAPLLHPILNAESSGLTPDGDQTFLKWVATLRQTLPKEAIQQYDAKLKRAEELAKLLEQRRIFREAVIIDGIHACDGVPPQEGVIEACRRLERAFFPKPDEKKRRKSFTDLFDKIENTLRLEFRKNDKRALEKEPEVWAVLGIRKWDRKYKQPLVLVCRPHDRRASDSRLDISPLFRCDDPPNVRKQLDAIQASYDALWRVYLFVHPALHDKDFLEVHEAIKKEFLKYAHDHTEIPWKNAVRFDQLLGDPIDIVSFLEKEAVRRSPFIDEVARACYGRVVAIVAELSGSDAVAGHISPADQIFSDEKNTKRIIGEITRLLKEAPVQDTVAWKARTLNRMDDILKSRLGADKLNEAHAQSAYKILDYLISEVANAVRLAASLTDGPPARTPSKRARKKKSTQLGLPGVEDNDGA